MLWSRSFTPAFNLINTTTVNALFREAFIEGKTVDQGLGFERDGYNIRWTVENGLGLVFIVSLSAHASSRIGCVSRTITAYLYPLSARSHQAAVCRFIPALASNPFTAD